MLLPTAASLISREAEIVRGRDIVLVVIDRERCSAVEDGADMYSYAKEK
jgi:hypothetical protein